MRRKLLIAASVAVVVGGTIAALVLAFGSAAREPDAETVLPPATAPVQRTTLVDTKTVPGTLGYGQSVPLEAGEAGVVTWIAPVGSIVRRGQPLFRVDERPVVLLYGTLPLYRTLRSGRVGRDVRELERNLAMLGYRGFTVDNTYSPATAAAVLAWQAKLGLVKTGMVEVGQVLFAPGPVRIAGHSARIGDGIGREGGAVVTYTGTKRLVSVELEVADLPLAVRGRRVTVTVPGRGAMKGRIEQVGTEITTQATPAGGGQAQDGAASAAADAVVQVTVSIANQKALGSLDAAPVEVDFVSNRRENVLAVPVVALLALPRAGFGVEVVQGTRTRIVPVTTGMFAAGRVEVRGQGIAEGVRVGVPK